MSVFLLFCAIVSNLGGRCLCSGCIRWLYKNYTFLVLEVVGEEERWGSRSGRFKDEKWLEK